MINKKSRGTETVTFFIYDRNLKTRWQCPRVMSKEALRQSSCNGLSEVLARLRVCGWYWGPISNLEATRKLKSTPCGTFLLRDSSDSRHLFTLSVRTANGMTSVRLLFKRGRFALDSVEANCEMTPNFDCVLKLIYYYVRVSNNGDGRSVFAKLDNDEADDTPLVLRKPLFAEVPTLKHLCRRVINTSQAPEEVIHMNLPLALENYLLKYPYPI